MNQDKAKEVDAGQIIGHFYCIAGEHDHKRDCNSSDALAVYQHESEDETWYDSYCYSCNQYFSKEETHNSSVAVSLGIKDGVVVEKKSFNVRPKPQPMTKEEVKDFIKKTGYKSNNYRGIRDDVSQFFGHLTKLDNNGNVIARYYPETQGTNVTGYKCRMHPKNFNYGKLGLTGQSCDLSGQIKFKGHSKYVLIVGGECYSEDTEVLTDSGWKFFKDVSNTDQVLQVHEGIGSFVTPLNFIKKEFKGDMINYHNKFNDILVI